MKLKADRHNFIMWILTEDPLMTNGQNHGLITIRELGLNLFSGWLVACSEPSHYPNADLMGTEFSDIWIKMQNFLVKNTFHINHSLETGDFFYA